MNKTTLDKLRQLIREEVHTAVKAVMSELLKEQIQQRPADLTEGKYVTNTKSYPNGYPKRRPTPAPRRAPVKQYSSDPTLNDILNSTSPLKENHNISDIVDSELLTMNDYAGEMSVQPSPRKMISTDIDNKPIPNTPEVNNVLDIMFNKDYGALMKKIDEKKGKR